MEQPRDPWLGSSQDSKCLSGSCPRGGRKLLGNKKTWESLPSPPRPSPDLLPGAHFKPPFPSLSSTPSLSPWDRAGPAQSLAIDCHTSRSLVFSKAQETGCEMEETVAEGSVIAWKESPAKGLLGQLPWWLWACPAGGTDVEMMPRAERQLPLWPAKTQARG